jgi:hypothetical protein
MTQISTTATSLQLMQTLQLSTSQSESNGAQKTSSQVGSSTDATSISGEAHTLILKDRLSTMPSRQYTTAMLSSPRRPANTMTIFFSDE